MCGRAVQTKTTLDSAEAILSRSHPSNYDSHVNKDEVTIRVNLPPRPPQQHSSTKRCCNDYYFSNRHDNLNLSPGMKSIVFCKEPCKTENGSPSTTSTATTPTSSTTTASETTSTIRMREKVWGIVSRAGTKNLPLDEGPAQHFSNMMFNARSDTLYEKRTYRDLAIRGNTCVWAIDGFFEWKQPDKNVLSKNSNKQPYFVCRRDGLPLLIPGLWKSVRTGRRRQRSQDNYGESLPSSDEDILLDTFTHLTTDTCAPLRWLHHRQPVFLWNSQFANEWILNPSEGLVNQMASLASGVMEEDSLLTWHPVTKLMSNVKYRNADSIKPIKIETVPSVKSFFIGGVKNSNKRKTVTNQDKSKSRTILDHLNLKCKDDIDLKRQRINEDVPIVTLSQSGQMKLVKVDHQEKTQGTKYDSKSKKKKGTITNFFACK